MRLCLFFLIFLKVQFVFAQENLSEKNIEIDSVKINVTKNFNSIKDSPFPLKVINLKDFLLFGNNTLNDVLQTQTGIAVKSTRTNGQGVQIQGLDASYVNILIDGFPMIGRSFGALDLKRINLNNIQKIEILKGNSSSFHGSNAIGGVINIITKDKNKNGSFFDSKLTYTTNKTINPSFFLSYKRNRFTINNSFNYYYTEGYDLIDSDLLKTINPYFNYNFNTNFKYSLSNSSFLKSNFRFFNQTQKNTAESFGSVFEGESYIKERSSSLSFTKKINKKLIIESDFYVTNYKSEEFLNDSSSNLFDDNFFDKVHINREIKIAYKKSENLSLFLGGGIQNESLERKDISFKPTQKLNFFYSQIDFQKTNKVKLVLGSRYDDYKDYKYRISNNLACGLKINKNLKFKTSFGTGFKIPDFRQRYFNFTQSTIGYTVLGREIVEQEIKLLQSQGLLSNVVYSLSDLGNTLNPESSFSINSSFNMFFEKIILYGNFFKNNINNLIEPQIVAYKNNSLPVFSYFNVEKVVTKGLELDLDWGPTDFLDFKLGYQLLYAFDPDVKKEFEAGNIYARDPQTLISFQLQEKDYIGLFNRSKHTFNLKTFYSYNKKLDIAYALSFFSRYATVDSNDNGVYDKYDEDISSYMLHDLVFSYKLNKKQTLQLGCNNIFDFTNPENISNISGRIFFFNFKTNFLI